MKKLLLVFFLCCISAFIALSQPIANFGSNLQTGCGAVQIIFLDSSAVSDAKIVSWKWDLGGVISDKHNPGRIFDKPGKYTICLTVTDDKNRSHQVCKEEYIIIYDKPQADFTIDKTSGCVPFTVNFTDLSKSTNGAIINWTWDIGGNTNVINTNDKTLPIQTTYETQGLKSATLTIKDDKGCESSVSKKDIIVVNAVPDVVLTKDYINTCELPWQVQLKNENVDVDAKYKWNLGNGTVFNGLQPPIGIFNIKKSYDLTIEVEKGECRDTFVYKSYINANPITKISLEKNEFCLGEEIFLRDSSDLGADSVLWRFGDGLISRDRNASHIYQEAGCFTVSLFRFRGNCRDTVIYNCVKVLEAPDPIYNITNQYTCSIPVNVSINSLSPGNYSWKIKGSNFDKEYTTPNVNFSVNQFDNYIVSLLYEDLKQCKVNIADTIKIKKFEANLPAGKIGGCVPYDVIMSDSIITEIPITNWQWTVGNPTIFTSTQQSPKFRLNNVGLYDVRLIVTNTFGCKDTIFRPGYIGGGTPPVVDFTASPLEDCLISERTFTDLSSSNANFWLWDFGDQSGAEGKEVKHFYGSPEIYDVTLTAMHNGCASSITKPQYINVLEPVSNYAIEYNCLDPFTVALNNLSIGADSLYWEIYDGNKRDTIRDSILTTYTFPGRGEYTISIYSKNFNTGCEHVRIDTIHITDPLAKFTIDTAQGCIPLEINFTDLSIDANITKYYFNAGDTIAADSFVYLTGGKQKPPHIFIQDIHGCTDTFTLDTFIFANAIDPLISYPAVACVPQLVTLGDISRDSFAVINRWKWSLSDSTYLDTASISANIEVAGTYTIDLYVEDTWGCKDSISIKNAIEAILLSPDFTSDTLGCTNTDMLFYPKGDNINTSEYIWTFGDGDSSNTPVARHQYSNEGEYEICLTLKDVRGCENSICKDQWIDIKDPVASFSGSPTEEICPPLLTTFINQSSNTNNYQWDFGDKSGFSYVENPSHIYSEPDSFDVSLIAIRSEACKDTLKFADYIKVLGPKGTFDYNLIGTCLPLQVEFVATSEDYYTYQWDFGNGDIDSSLTLNINETKNYTYTKPGKYSAKLIIKDNNGCARNFSQDDIIVNEINLGTKINNDLFCGLPAQINIENTSTSTSTITRYDWKLYSNGDSTSFSGIQNITTSLNNYGMYDVRLTATSENCTMDTLLKDMINIQPKPVALITFAKPEYCEFEEIEFINNSTIEFGNIVKNEWLIVNEPYNTKDVKASFDSRGNKIISLKITSEHNCTDETEVTVKINPTTSAALISDTVICLDQKITFTPDLINETASHLVEWNADNVQVCNDCDSYELAPGDTTELSYTITNEFGCKFSDTLIVNLAPVFPPSIDLGLDTILCLNTLAQLEVIDYNPIYKYEWFSELNFDCIDDCKSISTKVTKPGFFYSKATNEYHCFTIDSIYTGIEKEIPDFLISEKYICEDGTTTLQVKENDVVKWYDANQILCNGCDSIIVSPLKEQYYFVDVESYYGCSYKDSIFVNLVPLNSVEAGQDLQICLGEIKSLNGKGEGIGAWYFNDGKIGDGFSINHAPQLSGQYTLTAIQDECVLKDSIYVEVLIKSLIEAIGDTVCYGDTAYVSAEGLATEYNWLYENKSFQSNKEAFDFIPEETMTLQVIGMRTTCIPDTQEVLVYVHPKIEYQLVEDRYMIYYNSLIKVNAEYNDAYDYEYTWTPTIGLSCVDCPIPVIKDLEESMLYTITIKDPQSQCEIEQRLSANLNEECSKDGFFIPNIFVPNSPSSDNNFLLKTVYPEDFRSITILDRWGNKVFSSKDVNFTWDGKFNGRDIESGVYLYYIKAFCPELNKEFVFGGDVTILK